MGQQGWYGGLEPPLLVKTEHTHAVAVSSKSGHVRDVKHGYDGQKSTSPSRCSFTDLSLGSLCERSWGELRLCHMASEGAAAQRGAGALKRTEDLLHNQISLFTPRSKLSSASRPASPSPARSSWHGLTGMREHFLATPAAMKTPECSEGGGVGGLGHFQMDLVYLYFLCDTLGWVFHSAIIITPTGIRFIYSKGHNLFLITRLGNICLKENKYLFPGNKLRQRECVTLFSWCISCNFLAIL